MKAKIIILFIFLTPILVSAHDTDTTITPIKKEFFPLAVGNKYIYEVRIGLKKRKVISYDTIIVINRSLAQGYQVFELNDGTVYYSKNDSIFTLNSLEFQGPTYNLLYFVTKDSSYPNFHGSCGVTHVETSFLASYKQDQKIYTNCYKFYFQSENKVIIIAQGIGIIEMFQNGVTKKLAYIELH